MLKRRIRRRQRAMGNMFWGAVKSGAYKVGAPIVNAIGEPKALIMEGYGDVEGQYVAVGATDPTATPTTSVSDVIASDTFKTAATIALAYHGYRRTGSLLWTLVYAGFGRYEPVIALPVAFAQGFGKRRICTTE